LADIPAGDGRLPWLYGVARRVVSNHQRTMFRRGRLFSKAVANPSTAPRGPEDEAILHAETDAMLAALATLRDRDQEVLRLTYWEELPHADIGRILGCSAETVHVRRYRAETTPRALRVKPVSNERWEFHPVRSEPSTIVEPGTLRTLHPANRAVPPGA
jgi:RNA polymerase sigma-70 factor (ECF subfamily)